MELRRSFCSIPHHVMARVSLVSLIRFNVSRVLIVFNLKHFYVFIGLWFRLESEEMAKTWIMSDSQTLFHNFNFRHSDSQEQLQLVSHSQTCQLKFKSGGWRTYFLVKCHSLTVQFALKVPLRNIKTAPGSFLTM